MGALQALHAHYRERVAFLVIYIKEAHPEDGWVLASNRRGDIAVRDPVSVAERVAVAATCAVRLDIRMPVLIDHPDNPTASAYGGWPDRLYLIDRDGRVAYQGEEGPFGFEPAALERAIEHELQRAP